MLTSDIGQFEIEKFKCVSGRCTRNTLTQQALWRCGEKACLPKQFWPAGLAATSVILSSRDFFGRQRQETTLGPTLPGFTPRLFAAAITSTKEKSIRLPWSSSCQLHEGSSNTSGSTSPPNSVSARRTCLASSQQLNIPSHIHCFESSPAASPLGRRCDPADSAFEWKKSRVIVKGAPLISRNRKITER